MCVKMAVKRARLAYFCKEKVNFCNFERVSRACKILETKQGVTGVASEPLLERVG